jgi:hypothetical protein
VSLTRFLPRLLAALLLSALLQFIHVEAPKHEFQDERTGYKKKLDADGVPTLTVVGERGSVLVLEQAGGRGRAERVANGVGGRGGGAGGGGRAHAVYTNRML